MKTGVSFVVPVYDKAPYLPGVLERLAAQRGDFDREYVFVDDGSTDGSLAILKGRTAGWPDTSIVEQANHGVAHATNRGLERARMPFVKFCDADDLLVDGATQALLAALSRGGGGGTVKRCWPTGGRRSTTRARRLISAPIFPPRRSKPSRSRAG